MLQLPMQWLYNKFLGTVNTTLVKALSARFDKFMINLNVYRPGKVTKQARKASPLVSPFDNHAGYSQVLDMSFVAFDSEHVGFKDWYERTKKVEGNGLYLPTNKHILTVTGPWYKSSHPVDFGNVVGDCKFH